jgi:hypothetical protein
VKRRMALESIANELTFTLGFILVTAVIANSAIHYLAQQQVTNTIDLGVQGILGIDTLQEIDNATDGGRGGRVGSISDDGE